MHVKKKLLALNTARGNKMSFFDTEVMTDKTGNGTGARFNRFLANIQVTDYQTNDAVTKHERIRRALHAEYYSTPYSTTTSLLIGSYGKKTSVRPPRDIDLIFILPENVRSKFPYFTDNIQSRILQEIKLKLQRLFPLTKMSADGPVIYIPFSDSSFSVEVVPAFKRVSGGYDVCYTKNGGSWGVAYPEIEAAQLVNSNQRTDGNTTKLIKMIKVWQYFCNVELESFAIEILCQEFLRSYSHASKTSVYYDYMVRDFFKFISERWSGTVSKPGTLFDEININPDLWKSKAKSAYLRAQKACELEAFPTSANVEWRKIFGDYFVG